MASGFQGFLKGFAQGGAEIVKEQDKKQSAIDLFAAEQAAQYAIKRKNEQDEQQALVDADKSAITGPRNNNAPSDLSPAPATPSAPAQAPINPQAGNTAPTPVTATPTQADGINAVYPPSTDPTVAKGASFNQTMQSTAPTAPLANPTVSTNSVTAEDRAAALADVRAKGNKQAFSYDQLNALALQNKTEQTQKNQEFLDKKTAAADAHRKSNKEMGMDESGEPIKADDQTLELYGVPPAPNNAKSFGTRGDTIKAKLQDNVVKAKDAYEKIVADSNVFEKQLDEGAVTGGASTLLAALRQNVDSSYQIMKSINKDLTLESFKSSSNLRTQQEFKTLQDANASPSMKAEAARAILAKTKAFALMAAERQDFISNYAQAHNTLDGSSVMYDKYLEANPVFKQDGTAFEMVPDRKTYSEFFHPIDDVVPTGAPSAAAATSTSVNKPFKFQRM